MSRDDESEVIRDGLQAMLARDRAVEHWLVQEVGPAYDALSRFGLNPVGAAPSLRMPPVSVGAAPSPRMPPPV